MILIKNNSENIVVLTLKEKVPNNISIPNEYNMFVINDFNYNEYNITLDNNLSSLLRYDRFDFIASDDISQLEPGTYTYTISFTHNGDIYMVEKGRMVVIENN